MFGILTLTRRGCTVFCLSVSIFGGLSLDPRAVLSLSGWLRLLKLVRVGQGCSGVSGKLLSKLKRVRMMLLG